MSTNSTVLAPEKAFTHRPLTYDSLIFFFYAIYFFSIVCKWAPCPSRTNTSYIIYRPSFGCFFFLEVCWAIEFICFVTFSTNMISLEIKHGHLLPSKTRRPSETLAGHSSPPLTSEGTLKTDPKTEFSTQNQNISKDLDIYMCVLFIILVTI